MSLRDWFRRQIAPVPRVVAVCEFGCRQSDCRQGAWERCERRLRDGLPIDFPQRGAGGPDAAPEGAPEVP